MMLGDFVRGAGYILRGARLLRQPGVRRFVVIPVLVSVLTLSALIFLTVHVLGGIVTQWLPPSLDWLSWLILPLLIVLLAGIGVLTAGLLANIIAAPFNSDLARAVLATLAGKQFELPPSRAWTKDATAAVSFELHRLLFGMKWLVPTSLMALIPGVGLLATVIAWLLAAWTLALQYLDYPLALHQMTFHEQRQTASQQRYLTLGFGSAVALLHLIPFANFVAMPIAVAGATALWYERLRPPV